MVLAFRKGLGTNWLAFWQEVRDPSRTKHTEREEGSRGKAEAPKHSEPSKAKEDELGQ